VLAAAVLAISPAVAAAGTSPATTVASAMPLTVGTPQAGGGAHIDLWKVTLSGGEQVDLNVTTGVSGNDGYGYTFDLYAPGTTDATFPNSPAVASVTSNSNLSPNAIAIQAPYSGTFVLAVCQSYGGNCGGAYSGSSHQMDPYTFTTAAAGGITPAIAAAETQASTLVASATPLTVGALEAGGGSDVDLWQVTLSGGEQVNLNVTTGVAGNDGYGYTFDLYAPETTDGTFPNTPPVDEVESNPNLSPNSIALQAPYSGTFILAVCQSYGGDCRGAYSGTSHQMDPYTFTSTPAGGITPAIAAAETRASNLVASASPLTVGALEAGGGVDVDLWQITLAAGEQLNLGVMTGASGNDGYGYTFDLFAPGTTDTTFPNNAAVAGVTSNSSLASDAISIQAPYAGTFVLAVCQSYGGDCRGAYSGSSHQMDPYTFTTAAVPCGSSQSAGAGCSPPADSTSTRVACSPTSVTSDTPTSCTATVTDTSSSGPSTPSGAVNFTSSPTTGAFGSSGACTLAATTTGTASCQVAFTPSAGGGYTITAGYGGDAGHSASSGPASLTATALPLPPPMCAPCSPAAASLRIARQNDKVSSAGRLGVTVDCTTAPCTGTLKLTARVSKTTGGGRHKKTTTTETIGEASLSGLTVGYHAVAVDLDSTGRSALKHYGYVLNATATARYHSGSTVRTATAALSLKGTKPTR
jgi:hypothetical protein